MLNHHRKDRRRLWAGSAITASLVATSLVFGAAGHAQPSQGDGKEQGRERFVIMEMKEGEAPPAGLPREFRIRRGDNGEIIAPENCGAGSEAIANVNEGDGKNRTRIAEGNSERGTDHRAKVLETIDREIARLRGR